MVRIDVVFNLFMKLWAKNELYRLASLEHGGTEWSVDRVERELLANMELHLALLKNQQRYEEQIDNNQQQQHSWPWKVMDPSKTTNVFSEMIGVMRIVTGGEVRAFVQAHPCMFLRLDSAQKMDQFIKAFPVEKFGKHMARISDQRFMLNDRAPFVLNAMLIKKSIFTQVYAKTEEPPSWQQGIGDLKQLEMQLEQTIRAEKKHAEADYGDDEQQSVVVSDVLVSALINSLKYASHDTAGHPMARASYRRIMKCMNLNLALDPFGLPSPSATRATNGCIECTALKQATKTSRAERFTKLCSSTNTSSRSCRTC